jgi:hypothetical protein
MRTLLALLPVIAFTAWLPGEARATFIGQYNVANWTTPLSGSVNISGAPSAVVLLWGDNGCISQFSVACTLFFTIHAADSGLVTFHRAYQTTDMGGPSFDHFGHTLNGTFTQLPNIIGVSSQSGDNSFPVLAGSLFSFDIHCTTLSLVRQLPPSLLSIWCQS